MSDSVWLKVCRHCTALYFSCNQKKFHGKFDKIPRIGIFERKIVVMAKNTSILLGDYFSDFINGQVQTGKFSSASEVVRAALRMFEQEEIRKSAVVKELIKGEKSGITKDFNRDTFLKNIKERHLAK